MSDDTVEQFVNAVEDEARRNDSRELVRMMRDATASAPALCGSIVGFGTHHYRYDSGREGDTMAVGFSPRKSALVVYGLQDDQQARERVQELGPVRLGKGCVYIKRLSDVDTGVLSELIASAYTSRHNSDPTA
ncbi:DUF1801 domain-containing protein [Microbacterium enclense]|uniref:DUF1801 domain-containing protein n=1 Tax=Microbacterium enclense TaxID=993073 RepID=UPI003D70746D